jgi:uncharacterized protein YdhG (YjbR/CyaY superfamily)
VTTQPANVDDYIRSVPEGVRPVLERARQAIRTAAPEATETISYNMPTYLLGGRHLVHLAAWRRHLSLYPVPAGDEAFEREIAPYRGARSTARFPLDKPVPYELIGRLVALLVEQRGRAPGPERS